MSRTEPRPTIRTPRAIRAVLMTSCFLMISLVGLATPTSSAEMPVCNGVPLRLTTQIPHPDDGEWIIKDRAGLVYRPKPYDTIGIVILNPDGKTRVAIGLTSQADDCLKFTAQCVEQSIRDDPDRYNPDNYRPGQGYGLALDALITCSGATFIDP